ncbi:hypothetical protein [Halorubrum sp. AS12]|uniref:hypothetical protein n=1 Tax=Halorubrum sp. AS12 TaxID=3409687 RepID=UPI003DA6F1AB
MDLFTHLSLPVTASYVLRPGFFEQPWRFSLAGFSLLSDLDKLLGVPGLLHSAVTLVPITGFLFFIEYAVRRNLTVTPMVAAFIWSHLLLDVLDGGPVPLLFPLVRTGIGFQYPAQTVFGEGIIGVRLRGPLVALRMAVPVPDSTPMD